MQGPPNARPARLPHAVTARARRLAFGLAVAAATSSAAETDHRIEVELNKLEPAEDACRPYLVFRNQGVVPLQSLAMELVLFDTDGFILRHFSLEAAPLDAGKTSVKLFEIPDLQCDAIGRILLNHVNACAGADGALDDCMARIQLSSRLPVNFFK